MENNVISIYSDYNNLLHMDGNAGEVIINPHGESQDNNFKIGGLGPGSTHKNAVVYDYGDDRFITNCDLYLTGNTLTITTGITNKLSLYLDNNGKVITDYSGSTTGTSGTSGTSPTGSTSVFYISSNYTGTTLSNQYLRCSGSGETYNIYLKESIGSGQIIRIKNVGDSLTVVIYPNGTNQIEGLGSLTNDTSNKVYTLIDGTSGEWDILSIYP